MHFVSRSIAFRIHHDVNDVTSWAMPICQLESANDVITSEIFSLANMDLARPEWGDAGLHVFHDGSEMRNSIFISPRTGTRTRTGIVLAERFSERDGERSLLSRAIKLICPLCTQFIFYAKCNFCINAL
jgi:hypothetical protein